MLLPTRPPTPRRGLSLLEVLVALAIFLLSFVAIGRLVTLASDQALELQQHSQATRLAQSKLNEVLCGALGLESAEGSFDEDPDWEWSIEAEQNTQVSGLWTVTVTVTRPGDDGADVSASVSQMVFDPTLRGSVFDQTSVTGANDTAPSTSASASSQGSSGAAGQSTAGAATSGATKGGTTTPGRGGGGTTTPGRGGSGGTTTPGRGGGGTTTPGTTTPGRGGGGTTTPGTTTPGRGGGGTTTPGRGGG